MKFLGNASKLSKWIPTSASTYGQHLDKLSDSSEKDSSDYDSTNSEESERGMFDTLHSIISSPEKENFSPNVEMNIKD
jgi:hypothetical protein